MLTWHMSIACWITKNTHTHTQTLTHTHTNTHTYTHKICNTYCFFALTMVLRMPLNVTVYLYGLSFIYYIENFMVIYNFVFCDVWPHL